MITDNLSLLIDLSILLIKFGVIFVLIPFVIEIALSLVLFLLYQCFIMLESLVRREYYYQLTFVQFKWYVYRLFFLGHLFERMIITMVVRSFNTNTLLQLMKFPSYDLTATSKIQFESIILTDRLSFKEMVLLNYSAYILFVIMIAILSMRHTLAFVLFYYLNIAQWVTLLFIWYVAVSILITGRPNVQQLIAPFIQYINNNHTPVLMFLSISLLNVYLMPLLGLQLVTTIWLSQVALLFIYEGYFKRQREAIIKANVANRWFSNPYSYNQALTREQLAYQLQMLSQY